MDQQQTTEKLGELREPFPLKQRFMRHVLPLLAALVAASVAMSLYHGTALIERVYLEMAKIRATAISQAMERAHLEQWDKLKALQPNEAIPLYDENDPFRRALESTLVDARLARLKIYDDNARLIFSTQNVMVGEVEVSPALLSVLENKEPEIVLKEGEGEPLYELYIWIPDPANNGGVVFELYEPAEYLNSLLLSNVLPQFALPFAVMGGLTMVLWRIVSKAQRDIDYRAGALRAMGERLESLVSSQARGAVHAMDSTAMDSRVMDVTLLYGDIRSFTSYAEDNPPQDVVGFLNDVMTLQVRTIHKYGGDVDKMIGDAILAVFEGPDRAIRAVECARDILMEIEKQTEWPRRVGIGLHDGFVISGTIGPPERRDFTVIGDAVNVAARLCNQAGASEMVVDTRTLARAGHPGGFGEVEEIHVKGRSEPLRVRRAKVLPSEVNSPIDA